MATAATDILSVAVAASELRLSTAAASALSASLGRMIGGAVAEIEKRTGLNLVDRSVTVDATIEDRTRPIDLRVSYATAVTAARYWERGTPLGRPVDGTIDVTEITLDQPSLYACHLRRASDWPLAEEGRVRITLSAGVDASEVPPDIQDAAVLLVRDRFDGIARPNCERALAVKLAPYTWAGSYGVMQ